MCLGLAFLNEFVALICADSGKPFGMIEKGNESEAALSLAGHMTDGHTCQPVMRSASEAYDLLAQHDYV